MKCPHCLESFFPDVTETDIQWPEGRSLVDSHYSQAEVRIAATACPACHRFILDLQWVTFYGEEMHVLDTKRVWPKGVARSPLPAEVGKEFSEDYTEACRVLADSPKASAALSRRCLQHLLREKGGSRKRDLADQIDDVIQKLPSHLAEAIDAVRIVGNFAAHPIKSKSSGEIVPVVPGEAEWLLDVLEALFDFYIVQPAKLAAKRGSLNEKLQDAGKPPMK